MTDLKVEIAQVDLSLTHRGLRKESRVVAV